jgi:hypothetical protein
MAIVRHPLHADGGQVDPLLIVAKLTEHWTIIEMLQVRNFCGGFVEQTHTVKPALVIEFHLKKIYVKPNVLVIPGMPFIETEAFDHPSLLYKHFNVLAILIAATTHCQRLTTSLRSAEKVLLMLLSA